MGQTVQGPRKQTLCRRSVTGTGLGAGVLVRSSLGLGFPTGCRRNEKNPRFSVGFVPARIPAFGSRMEDEGFEWDSVKLERDATVPEGALRPLEP